MLFCNFLSPNILADFSNYLELLKNYNGLLINIDGKESIEKAHINIVKYLEKII